MVKASGITVCRGRLHRSRKQGRCVRIYVRDGAGWWFIRRTRLRSTRVHALSRDTCIVPYFLSRAHGSCQLRWILSRNRVCTSSAPSFFKRVGCGAWRAQRDQTRDTRIDVYDDLIVMMKADPRKFAPWTLFIELIDSFITLARPSHSSIDSLSDMMSSTHSSPLRHLLTAWCAARPKSQPSCSRSLASSSSSLRLFARYNARDEWMWIEVFYMCFDSILTHAQDGLTSIMKDRIRAEVRVLAVQYDAVQYNTIHYVSKPLFTRRSFICSLLFDVFTAESIMDVTETSVSCLALTHSLTAAHNIPLIDLLWHLARPAARHLHAVLLLERHQCKRRHQQRR